MFTCYSGTFRYKKCHSAWWTPAQHFNEHLTLFCLLIVRSHVSCTWTTLLPLVSHLTSMSITWTKFSLLYESLGDYSIGQVLIFCCRSQLLGTQRSTGTFRGSQQKCSRHPGVRRATDTDAVAVIFGNVQCLQTVRSKLYRFRFVARWIVEKGNPSVLPPFDEEQQKSFDTLKSALASPPLLSLLRADSPYSVDTDASSYQIGCALFQEHEDSVRHLMRFWPCSLTPPENSYSFRTTRNVFKDE